MGTIANAANITYISTAAPVASGSTILGFGGTSCLELSYIGTVNVIGDGSNASAIVNFIDGTNALAWTPTAFLAFRQGGNATNTVAVLSANVLNNVAASIVFSAAPGSNATATVLVMVFK